MTRDELKVNLPRWGTLVGIVLALLSIAAIAISAGDDRYVKRTDYQNDLHQMRSDLRVLRCVVAKDCQ